MNLLPFLETTLPGIMIPSIILTDSYKMAHFSEYPECEKMVAYGEFRKPLDKDDNRIVFYGIRYWIKIIAKQWTLEDVSKCEIFLSTHNIGEPYPFPRDLFISFINECDGHFPVEIEALDEASVIYPHVPVFQITALNKYSKLVTFLETLLTMIWYPCNVATISRHTKSAIDLYYSKTVDEGSFSSIHTKLHDFGFRGCTSVDQSVIGGVAHLLNFTGSDTLSACYYAQFELNKGRPVGFSIPATEHSVMTAWQSEEAAIRNMIEKYGEGVYACVMDSYDYVEALSSVLPNIAKEKTAKGGYLVLRPDSGDPVTTVLQALDASDKVFGSVLNSKGYKVVQGCGVIQGDGISKSIVLDILKAAESKGYSAENISFGMGAGLLQKHNRDTMSFATKLCFIEYSNKTVKHVMKSPKTDDSKTSLPGQLAVLENELGLPVVYPKNDPNYALPNLKPLLKSVYNGLDPNKRVFNYEHPPSHNSRAGNDFWDIDFSDLKYKLESKWKQCPLIYDPLSAEIKDKIRKIKNKTT